MSIDGHDCRKQTEVCCFRFLFAANKRKLPFYIYLYWNGGIYVYISLNMCILIYIYFYIYVNIYIYAAISNGKWKMEAQAIFPNQFPACSLCKRKFVVCPICLWRNKWKLSVGLNWLNRVSHLGLYQTVGGPSIQYRYHFYHGGLQVTVEWAAGLAGGSQR